jgi:hypothetical protein
MPISCLEAQIRHQSWEDEKNGRVSHKKSSTNIKGLPKTFYANMPTGTSGFTEFMQQNYSYAILIYKGIVVDGLYRIIHALLDGKELIAAQSFNELPAEAFATPKGRQNEAESSAGVFSRCYV